MSVDTHKTDRTRRERFGSWVREHRLGISIGSGAAAAVGGVGIGAYTKYARKTQEPLDSTYDTLVSLLDESEKQGLKAQSKLVKAKRVYVIDEDLADEPKPTGIRQVPRFRRHQHLMAERKLLIRQAADNLSMARTLLDDLPESELLMERWDVQDRRYDRLLANIRGGLDDYGWEHPTSRLASEFGPNIDEEKVMRMQSEAQKSRKHKVKSADKGA